jgi:hypothetical protein
VIEKILDYIFPRSVDRIVATFTRTISQLEAHAAKSHDHDAEAERAANTAEKLKGIIA